MGFRLIKIDTGAEENILPMKCFDNLKLNCEILKPCHLILESYMGNVLKSRGIVQLPCHFNEIFISDVKFIVVETNKIYCNKIRSYSAIQKGE